MDETRVEVKLTNAVDEGLLRRGQVAPDQVRVYEPEVVAAAIRVRRAGTARRGFALCR